MYFGYRKVNCRGKIEKKRVEIVEETEIRVEWVRKTIKLKNEKKVLDKLPSFSIPGIISHIGAFCSALFSPTMKI